MSFLCKKSLLPTKIMVLKICKKFEKINLSIVDTNEALEWDHLE